MPGCLQTEFSVDLNSLGTWCSSPQCVKPSGVYHYRDGQKMGNLTDKRWVTTQKKKKQPNKKNQKKTSPQTTYNRKKTKPKPINLWQLWMEAKILIIFKVTFGFFDSFFSCVCGINFSIVFQFLYSLWNQTIFESEGDCNSICQAREHAKTHFSMQIKYWKLW